MKKRSVKQWPMLWSLALFGPSLLQQGEACLIFCCSCVSCSSSCNQLLFIVYHEHRLRFKYILETIFPFALLYKSSASFVGWHESLLHLIANDPRHGVKAGST